MREREVRETHCLVSSSHRTPDNLHSAKNNTARLHKILMREFKLSQQYELVYSQSGKSISIFNLFRCFRQQSFTHNTNMKGFKG